MKIVEENIGSKISDIAHGNILSDISFQARETKGKINKWDYIKLKSFCIAKDNFFADTSYKGLISKIYKELNKQEKQPTQLKMGKGLE